MRNRSLRRQEQLITSNVQRGEPTSLASVPAATVMRILSDSVPQPGVLFHLRDTHISGALELRHASLGVPVVFEGCTFDNPLTFEGSDVPMLKFASCTLPAFEGRNLRVASDLALTNTHVGQINLFGARVGGQLWLNRSHVQGNGNGHAINAPQIDVVGGCYARWLTVHGCFNLWGATIRAGLELHGATLVAKEVPALRAPHMSVTGDVTLEGTTVKGSVDLSSATVGGALMLRYRVDDEHEVSVEDSRINGLRVEISPAVHVRAVMTGAVVTSVFDRQELWPRVLELDRMTYETLRPVLPAKQRLEWLARNEDSVSPQPYEQLARQYREAGHDHDARTVLLAKYRNRTRQASFPGNVWGYVQDVTVGYGYRPGRALAWLAGLTAVVAVSGLVWQPRPLDGSAPTFNAGVYALDVVLPILDLGQEKTHGAVGFGSIVVWLAILAGWVLASTVVAAVTRSVSRS